MRKVDISTVIDPPLAPKLATVNGITLYLQPVQDLTVEDRVSRTQYQYSLEGSERRRIKSMDQETRR